MSWMLFHEEIGRAAVCVIRVLIQRRCRVFRRTTQVTWSRIRVEIAVNWMKRQIAIALTSAFAIWRMDHLSARSHAGLAHGTPVGHYGAGSPRFLRTLSSHDRCGRRATGDKNSNRPRKQYCQCATMHRIHSLVFPRKHSSPFRVEESKSFHSRKFDQPFRRRSPQ